MGEQTRQISELPIRNAAFTNYAMLYGVNAAIAAQVSGTLHDPVSEPGLGAPVFFRFLGTPIVEQSVSPLDTGIETCYNSTNSKIDGERRLKLKIEETRTFGVEIECLLPRRTSMLANRLRAIGLECYVESYNHNTRAYWKIVPDATVTSESGYKPMELVSPPLRGRDGFSQLKKICEVLVELGAKVNRSCGFHVHHDARDFDLEAWKIVVKSYLKYESTIDELMAPSRRGDGTQYVRSCIGHYAGYTFEDVWRRADEAPDEWNLRRMFGTRYTKLNLEAYELHGTVEYRQHGGTTNFAKMAAWICLTQGFVNRAVSHKKVMRVSTAKPFDSLMYTVDACVGVRNFYAARYEPEV